jgi:hypothetical protein
LGDETAEIWIWSLGLFLLVPTNRSLYSWVVESFPKLLTPQGRHGQVAGQAEGLRQVVFSALSAWQPPSPSVGNHSLLALKIMARQTLSVIPDPSAAFDLPKHRKRDGDNFTCKFAFMHLLSAFEVHPGFVRSLFKNWILVTLNESNARASMGAWK